MKKNAELTREGLKACTKCAAIKPLSDFKLQKRKTGMFPTSWCRACLNAKSNESMKFKYRTDPEFRARHREHSERSHARPENRARKNERERQRRALPEEKEKANERSAAWIAANPERHAANKAAWRDRPGNREKMREYVRRYREKNPDLQAMKVMVRLGERRWRIFNQGNTMTVIHMQLAQEFWGWSCAYCGERTRSRNGELTQPSDYRTGLDHVVAISLGGAHAPGNMVVCCFRCNTRKNKYPLPEELMAKLAEQLEVFVGALPPEAEYKGMGRPSFATIAACQKVADEIRGMGEPVGTAWSTT
jgi:5-methylcytosine-specific restriction endonuclease McrA